MADSWILSYLNKNLWFCLIRSEHFKWYGLKEQILAEWNDDLTMGYQVISSQWCVYSSHNVWKSYWLVLTNISDVKTEAILSVFEAT